MVDSFIDVAIWLTITILIFNIFAIYVNTNTINDKLKVTGFDNTNLHTFTNSTGDINGSGNTIGDTVPQASTDRQTNLNSYEGDLLGFLSDLFLMWNKILYAVIPQQAIIIADIMSVIIGIVELTGLLALGMRLATAIGALIPFT